MVNYEGLFLLDNKEAKNDWNGIHAYVTGLLQKHGVEIVRTLKWGERKLAYDIGSHKRGTYLLSYFRVDPKKITELKRDLELSEKVIRHLFLHIEEIPPETATIALSEEEDLVLGGPEEDMMERRGRRGDSSFAIPGADLEEMDADTRAKR